MGLRLNIEKKYLYIILAVFAIGIMCISAVIVIAGHGDSNPTTWTLKPTYHFLQQVVGGDTKVSVDYNNNGVIDNSDDVTCTGCIVSGEIADGTITSTDIGDGQVTSADIADGTITSTDITDGTITSTDIQDGSISTSDISGTSFLYAASPTASGSATNAYACNADATCEMQSATATGTLGVSGSVTAGSFYYSSDARLKQNVKQLPNAVEMVQQLNGYSFEWKKDGRKDIGLFAQDVEKVYPELVSTDPSTGYKSVEYANLVAVLIEAVKEQQKEIDILKEKCNS